jgi:hypothetical protein
MTAKEQYINSARGYTLYASGQTEITAELPRQICNSRTRGLRHFALYKSFASVQNYKTIHKYCKLYDIDLSHLTG